jgi:hypothetical protein
LSLFLLLEVLFFSSLVFSSSLDAAIENVDDGQEVICKLSGFAAFQVFIENHEFDSME